MAKSWGWSLLIKIVLGSYAGAYLIKWLYYFWTWGQAAHGVGSMSWRKIIHIMAGSKRAEAEKPRIQWTPLTAYLQRSADSYWFLSLTWANTFQ
jgi:hypothetical protein